MKILVPALLVISSIIGELQAQVKSTQDSIQQFSDSTFTILEAFSLYGGNIEWQQKKETLLLSAQKASSFGDVFPYYQHIFDELKDNHSFFWYNNKKYASNFGHLDESMIRKPLIMALENGKGQVTVSVINNIGYVLIPQDNTSDDFEEMQRSAQALHDSLCKIYSQDIEGWIIDLRLNTGGNMYPMIAGIIPFLRQGVFASTVDRNNQKKDWWVDENSIYEGTKKITQLKHNCLPDLSSSKIVVLTSEITGSSGEITALSLSKRPNTYFIGEKSAGYMTSNELFRLPFGTFLLLTNAYEADRDGQIIKFIKPDLYLKEGDNFNDLSKDSKVTEAIKWLKMKNNN